MTSVVLAYWSDYPDGNGQFMFNWFFWESGRWAKDRFTVNIQKYPTFEIVCCVPQIRALDFYLPLAFLDSLIWIFLRLSQEMGTRNMSSIQKKKYYTVKGIKGSQKTNVHRKA